LRAAGQTVRAGCAIHVAGRHCQNVNNLADNTKTIIGRPRVPYTEASTRTKYEIKKKARRIYEESNTSMKKQLDELTLGCSEEVLVDISSPTKISPSKVGQLTEQN